MNGGIPEQYVSNRTNQSAAVTENVRLFHGTDLVTADWVGLHGFNYERMQQCCPGSWALWATTDPSIAHMYATMNPAQGTPAIVVFDFPGTILRDWLAMRPPLAGEDVTDRAYCFLPATFATINNVRVNYSVQVATTILNIAWGEP